MNNIELLSAIINDYANLLRKEGHEVTARIMSSTAFQALQQLQKTPEDDSS